MDDDDHNNNKNDNGDDDDDDVVTHGNWLNLIAVDWWEGVIGTRLDCFLKKGENYRNFSDLWTTLEVVAAKMQCHMVKFVGWLPLWCSGSTGWFSVFFGARPFQRPCFKVSHCWSNGFEDFILSLRKCLG
jgi:hypothetical protein